MTSVVGFCFPDFFSLYYIFKILVYTYLFSSNKIVSNIENTCIVIEKYTDSKKKRYFLFIFFLVKRDNF